MSDSRSSNQAHDPAPRLAEASAAAGASSSKPAQGQASAATQYWQGVAAAGRTAKSAAAAPAQIVTPGRQRGMRA